MVQHRQYSIKPKSGNCRIAAGASLIYPVQASHEFQGGMVADRAFSEVGPMSL